MTLDSLVVLPVTPLLHAGGADGEENPPTDVVVLAGFVTDTFGELPFYDLPCLGGSNSLRGYFDNRFSDRAAMHALLEYCMGLVARGYAFRPDIRIERISLGFCYDIGTSSTPSMPSPTAATTTPTASASASASPAKRSSASTWASPTKARTSSSGLATLSEAPTQGPGSTPAIVRLRSSTLTTRLLRSSTGATFPACNRRF